MSMVTYVIEDEFHAEWCGQFATRAEALAELEARSALPWDQSPNVCPCMSWRTCGREYVIIEFNNASKPWEELSRTSVLSVSSKGVVWEPEFAAQAQNSPRA
jgi:hypothetical protein